MSTKFCMNIEFSIAEAISMHLLKLSTLIRERCSTVVYYIDSSHVPPHLTLHYMYLPEPKLKEAIQVISKVVRRNPIPQLEFEYVEAYQNGILSLPCKGTSALSALHKDLVLTLEPVRGGSVDPDLKHRLKDRPEFYKRNLRKYGYPYVLEEFRPHIALARVKRVPFHELESLARDLNKLWVPMKFEPDTIAVRAWVESGDVGSTIAQYNLHNSET